eukprot:12817255-Heterocapsa_arctica.AAC.1
MESHRRPALCEHQRRGLQRGSQGGAQVSAVVLRGRVFGPVPVVGRWQVYGRPVGELLPVTLQGTDIVELRSEGDVLAQKDLSRNRLGAAQKLQGQVSPVVAVLRYRIPLL